MFNSIQKEDLMLKMLGVEVEEDMADEDEDDE
jgi:hypothetical protein